MREALIVPSPSGILQCLREATIAQIEHFGQTPSQLFATAHAPRYGVDDVIPSIFRRLNGVKCYVKEKVSHSFVLREMCE